MGFEPTVRKAYNGFRDRPIRPLWHPSEALYSGAIERARVLDCDLWRQGCFVWIGGQDGQRGDGRCRSGLFFDLFFNRLFFVVELGAKLKVTATAIDNTYFEALFKALRFPCPINN